MSVGPLLARAGAWLVDPIEEDASAGAALPVAIRPVVAVFGLGSDCGTTVVARAVAAELAARYAPGAAAVCALDPAAEGPIGGRGRRGVVVPLGSPAAGRLARTLEDIPRSGVRAMGRLCLAEGADPLTLADTCRHHAPLVLDAGGAALGGAPAAVADHVLLVACPETEPALAPVAAACLERVVPDPLVVLNGGRDAERWEGRARMKLPSSRVGAQIALAGWERPGELGRAVRELVDLMEGR